MDRNWQQREHRWHDARVLAAVNADVQAGGQGLAVQEGASASNRDRIVNYMLTRADNRNACHTPACMALCTEMPCVYADR